MSGSEPISLDRLLSLDSDARLAHFRRLPDPCAAMRCCVEEIQRAIFNSPAQALAGCEAMISAADALGDASVRAQARRARAQALGYAGRYDESLAACADALEIASRGGAGVEAARAKLAMMQPLAELGRYEDAIQAGQAARAALSDLGQRTLAGKADMNLGAIHQKREDPARALAHLDRARESFAGETLSLGLVEINRGEALLKLDEFEAAEAAFSTALSHLESAGAEMMAAVTEGNLADLAARRGLLQRALYHFERARRRVESDEAQTHHARLLAEQAEALANLGLVDEALRSFENVLPRLDSLGLALEAARARKGHGRCLARRGRPVEALAMLEAAADGYEALGNSAERARVELLASDVALAAGQPAVALSLIRSASDGLTGRATDVALLAFHRARLALARGDAAAAADSIDIAVRTALPLGIAPLTADLMTMRGTIAAQRGRPAEAVGDFREAIAQIERVRSALNADRFRAAYLGSRTEPHERLVLALLETGAPPEEAFAVVEHAKSRSLLDLAGNMEDAAVEDDEDDPAERDLRHRAGRARADLNALYTKLNDPAAASNERWRTAVQRLEAELASLESRLAAGREAVDLLAPPADASRIRSSLGEDTDLVEYFIAGDEIMAWRFGRVGVRLVRRIATRAGAGEAAQRLQFQLARALRPGALDGPRLARLTDDTLRELRRLWDVLLAPVLADDCPERLIIVPHGPLHGLPLHAAHDGAAFLAERATVGYSPSASVWYQLGRPAARLPRRGSMLVVGVADEAAPRIEDEARLVAAIHPGARLIVGAAATVDAVRPRVRDVDQVHFACHAEFNPHHPHATGLRLADRHLTTRDIHGLRLKAELVTLSACDSGRSLVEAGDELLGLLRAFLGAGARRVLAGLWPVQDEISLKLFAGFHTMLMSGEQFDPAYILRQAQVDLIRNGVHPVLWAPFFIMGRA
ncbi:MAG: CHAT domain-containing protein [Planctomycetota bacterium]